AEQVDRRVVDRDRPAEALREGVDQPLQLVFDHGGPIIPVPTDRGNPVVDSRRHAVPRAAGRRTYSAAMGTRLAGKVALVFGAGSSGEGMSNGRAAALAFAREGARVAAVDVDAEAAERTSSAITAEGGSTVAVTADVTDESAVAAAVASAERQLGPPTVLHNNVGLARTGELVDLTRERWQQALDVNLTGVFLTCKHVLPWMLAAGGGAIVNVSSVASIRDTGYVYPGYAAAKAAVNQLTVSLALRYA